MRTRGWFAGFVVVVAVSGCGRTATVSDEPVSRQAEAPYACDGVPWAGARAMIPGDLNVLDDDGSWSDPNGLFHCTFTDAGPDTDGAEGAVLTVIRQSGLYAPFSDEASARESLSMLHDEQITADAPGFGYAWVTETEATAVWACGDVYLDVTSYVLAPGRDSKTDVENYLVSMLPWACGDQPAPEADTQQ